jgi:hypothetical protein
MSIPDDIVGLKYMRADDENLYFVNNHDESWQLTNNFNDDPYVNEIQDLSTIIPQVDGFVTNGIHCVLDKGFFLFSDGINLFAINNDFESTQLTIN